MKGSYDIYGIIFLQWLGIPRGIFILAAHLSLIISYKKEFHVGADSCPQEKIPIWKGNLAKVAAWDVTDIVSLGKKDGKNVAP